MYLSKESVVMDVFFPNVNTRLARITRDFHIVQDMDCRLLIGSDIIEPDLNRVGNRSDCVDFRPLSRSDLLNSVSEPLQVRSGISKVGFISSSVRSRGNFRVELSVLVPTGIYIGYPRFTGDS